MSLGLPARPKAHACGLAAGEVRMRESATGVWPRRAFAAWCVRALIVGVPIGACIGTGVVVSRWLPHPLGIPGHVLWLVGVLACSAVAFVAVQRVARRF